MNEIEHRAMRPAPSLANLLDRGEQVVVVLLWSWLALRVVDSPNPLAPVLLASEGLIVLFTLLRRPSANISVNTMDWTLAFAATILPLLVDPSPRGPEVLAVPGVLLFVLGACWQLWAKLVLRRSFGIAPANRGIKIGGPYQAMRHPMYFGYLLSNIGILMIMPSLLNFGLYALAWTFQLKRLLREEDLLLRDAAYQAYARQVRWRLIPRAF